MSSSPSHKAFALLRRELAAVFAAPAFLILLLAVSLLTGYSFSQAVSLFGQASRSALASPALARGLSPFDGVLVPTFGAVYLAAALLYPFLAIRSISQEKESGGLKLLLQLPLELPAVVAVKLAALAAAWSVLLCIPLSAVGLWLLEGGHVSAPELACLLLGHSLYGLAITGLAFLAAAATESTAAAAIVTLAAVVGNWALDFGASQGGWLRALSSWSLTSCLSSFERGLLDLSKAAVLITAAALGAALSVVWLRLGRPVSARWRGSLVVLAACLLAGGFLQLPSVSKDATEDRRNSFSAEDERALGQIQGPLRVSVYLSPDDSRLADLERTVLSKLRRVVRRADVRLEAAEGGALAGSSDDRYGLIALEYDGKTEQTRSTSEEELLPLIYKLAGVKAPPAASSDYPGYPLVADATIAGWWFYLVLPGLLGLGWRHLARRKA